MKIYVVDIGSEMTSRGKENFAWICEDGNFGNRLFCLKNCLKEDLKQGFQISIGFESPLFFDIYDKDVNKQRIIDEGRSWSAAAGATATVTGLTQIYWLFKSLFDEINNLEIDILKRKDEIKDDVNIYVWEAFVTKKAKSDSKKETSHIDDCVTALAHYKKMLKSNFKSKYEEEEVECMSLIGALLLRINGSIDPQILKNRPIVIKPEFKNKDFKWTPQKRKCAEQAS